MPHRSIPAALRAAAAVIASAVSFSVVPLPPLDAQELTGARAPATTPSLSAPASQALFRVPEGFEIRLFAAEPMVINPVAMTWDARGRLWVLELYEYPLGAPEGAKPRDRIRILEDTDGDELADRVTLFAEGLDLATGLLVGQGGVFVGQAPHLLFLEDTDGDDRADRRTVLKTGFGREDTHELLNGFAWGPDGWLYMTHGVFTHSNVRNPDAPEEDGFRMNAAVARYHPGTGRFEVFADGTSNPWGVDFDADGNAFITACVIDHMFHMAPGGLYVRQSGAPEHSFTYELLPSIVDHRHFRAAFAGVQVYHGHQYPEEYRGTIFQGNIHGNAIHQDRLERAGATFRASFLRDFVATDDGWFRPVSTQTGPDGCLWIMDWHDKYPCYQNARANPEGVDRSHGRIWRVVHTGAMPGSRVPCHVEGGDLAAATTPKLVETLGHPNNWHRRTARRILSERKDEAARPLLAALVRSPAAPPEARLEALLALHGAGMLEESLLDEAASQEQENLRTWAARLTGERANGSPEALERLRTLSEDASPQVRLAVAVAVRQHTSGALTVNLPAPDTYGDGELYDLIARLVEASKESADATLPFLIWSAAEPLVARDPAPALAWLAEDGPDGGPLAESLVYKTMLRLCDTRELAAFDRAAEFLDQLASSGRGGLARAALGGLLEGQKGRAIRPENVPATLFEALRRVFADDQGTLQQIGQLGALWGDAEAVAGTLAVAGDAALPIEERVAALKTAAQFRTPDAREQVTTLVTPDQPPAVAVEALRTLRRTGDDATGAKIIERWGRLTPFLRREAAQLLVSRPAWTNALVSAMEEDLVAVADVPAPVVRVLLENPSEHLRGRAEAVIGSFRPTSGELADLIAAKRNVVVADDPPVDLAEGRLLATAMCLTCHQLHGTGQDVGPDLTGVGRSSVDTLLANIIDPNQIIGRGFELVNVRTRDDRMVSGRLMEDSDARVRLRFAGGGEEVIAREDVASVEVTDQSVMPPGLHNLPDAQFRNLVWFILNPPEDGRELTPDLRRQLIDGGAPAETGASTGAAPPPAPVPADGESVALWNPEWEVICPPFEGAPRVHSEFRGRKNVLMTHPADRTTPAELVRRVKVPAKGTTRVVVDLASHERGNWCYRVFANDKPVLESLVHAERLPWQSFSADLSAFAGQEITLRLENAANGWEWEFGYWHNLRLVTEEPSSVARD